MTKHPAMARNAVLATVLASGFAAIATPAHAMIGAVDRVPAATLLVPYFEANLADPNGAQTRFTITNVSPTPRIAHAVLWTDLGVPTFSIDLFLGGRDSVEVDLRQLFSGVVPQTSPTLFAAGPYSDPHQPVAGCPLAASALYAGMPAPALLPDAQLEHLRAAHTGDSSPAFGGMCSAVAHSDSIARGYVTVDVANTCHDGFPTDPGYFIAGGTGVAGDDNVLIGQYTLIERRDRVATANPMVSIEASATDPLTTTPGTATFYGGYVAGSAADNREVLADRWRARTLDVGFFDPGTELIIWRDPVIAHSPFACGSPPADFPRQQAGIVAFDEEENPTALNGGVTYPNPQPPAVYPASYMTQRIDASMITPYASGSIYFDFTGSVPGTSSDAVQSFVACRHRLNGVFGAALPGEALTNEYQVWTGF
jgi:hypothetical protein